MATEMRKRDISRYVLIGFYFFAGFNHFLMPEFYLPLIPQSWPAPEVLNVFGGLAEMAIAVAYISGRTRKWAMVALVALLIAFIPIHIDFIVKGSCVGSLCVPAWLGWLRLLLVHPLLILWAIYAGKTEKR